MLTQQLAEFYPNNTEPVQNMFRIEVVSLSFCTKFLSFTYGAKWFSERDRKQSLDNCFVFSGISGSCYRVIPQQQSNHRGAQGIVNSGWYSCAIAKRARSSA